MSTTTFGNMSNPDLLFTLQAYNYMKLKINDRMMEILEGEEHATERSKLCAKNARIDELIKAILEENNKRLNG